MVSKGGGTSAWCEPNCALALARCRHAWWVSLLVEGFLAAGVGAMQAMLTWVHADVQQSAHAACADVICCARKPKAEGMMPVREQTACTDNGLCTIEPKMWAGQARPQTTAPTLGMVCNRAQFGDVPEPAWAWVLCFHFARTSLSLCRHSL